ncbi:arpin isoform X3 [Trachypithecus francoisi]|nr:arpin isoform X3 [Trachypithecus francoisi]
MSSYKVEAKGDTDRLTPEALKGLVNKPELLALTESLAPDHTVAFWMPESEMEAMELELGAGVRLKTRGDGPFLDSLAKLEAGTVTKCNFAGDGKTGASWTDNIMAQKCSEGAAAEIREQGDGAEDEEWVGQWGTVHLVLVQLNLLAGVWYILVEVVARMRRRQKNLTPQLWWNSVKHLGVC